MNYPRAKLPRYEELPQEEQLNYLGHMTDKILEPMAQKIQYIAARVENLTTAMKDLSDNMCNAGNNRSNATRESKSETQIMNSTMTMEGTKCNSWEELRDKFDNADFVRKAEIVYSPLDLQNVTPYIMEQFLGRDLM